jgi:uncharacterized protein YvpB
MGTLLKRCLSVILAAAVLAVPASVAPHAALALPAAVRRAPTAIRTPLPATTSYYVVQPGDTLWDIALRFGRTMQELAAANNLAWPWPVYVGQTLVIPDGSASSVAARQLTVIGHGQTYPLSCEARAAVDWAGYFGVTIAETEFFRHLPASDDPDAGFVGSVYGTWGQLPPRAYGVHAKPVAELLRKYGLNAQARTGMTWEQLRGEIDANRPVIVWVTGHVWDGMPVAYKAPSTGRVVTVARYEHTIIVTGYAAGPGWEQVTVVDGRQTYSTTLAQFLRSWSALGNMAVTLGN